MSTHFAQQVLTSIEPEHDRVAARRALAEDKIVKQALASQAHIACRGSEIRCQSCNMPYEVCNFKQAHRQTGMCMHNHPQS